MRERILPLFSFNPNSPMERPRGHGTAFRIDLWSRCATAFHVLEDLFEVDRAGTAISLKPDIRLIALDLTGRLHYSSWDDNDTTRYGVEIIAETINFF